jgi:hypothetical protein
VALFMREDLGTKFLVVSLSQDIGVEVARLSESLDIVTIAFEVPFQFRECQIVGFQREKVEPWPSSFKERNQPLLIVLRWRSDGDCVQVDLVLVMESGTFAADLCQFLPHRRDNAQEIDIAG